MFGLKKKFFIITGAFRGNGKVIANNIIKNNGRVISLDKKFINTSKSKNKILFKCDITSSSDVKKIFKNLNPKIKKIFMVLLIMQE